MLSRRSEIISLVDSFLRRGSDGDIDSRSPRFSWLPLSRLRLPRRRRVASNNFSLVLSISSEIWLVRSMAKTYSREATDRSLLARFLAAMCLVNVSCVFVAMLLMNSIRDSSILCGDKTCYLRGLCRLLSRRVGPRVLP